MIFSKTIIAEDSFAICEIKLKVTTDGNLLTAGESKREFNKALDEVYDALRKLYNVSSIKIK